jgi:subfamily B ATP-binding cassette protein HlyB/CyaB
MASNQTDDAAVSSITFALLKSGYPQPDLDKVRTHLAGLTLRKCKPGETLIKEGDKPGDAYVTHTGALEVYKHTGGTQDTKIAEVGPGSVVGEMALLTGFQRSATVKAKGEAEVFVLSPKDFHMLLSNSPAFKAKMEALVEERKKALARV